MRQRLARLGTTRPQTPVLDPLFRVIRANHPKADLSVVERAYRTAEQHHAGQLRKSGDAYITHPLAVTTILAELGMTEATLCAALLHDTVEDTDYTLAQLTRDFGEEVALLVDGCTKLDKVKYGDSAKSETIRKMVIAMSRDIRVLVIKLADRLHNMRTLHYLRPDKQSRIATETLEIFAPLAHRLGMNAIKWELEDLAFATLHPKVYDEIVRLVAEAAPSRDEWLAGGDRAGAGRPQGRQDQGLRHRPAQALLLDLPEDGRPRPRLPRHLRPGRAAGAGRGQPRLLRRARRAARPLEPPARAVQGLHRDAEVQHVPVAAHHGAGAGRQAGRAADPHRGDAPAGRVRRRRALEVQGGQGRRRRRRTRATPASWCGSASCMDWQRETADPGEFLDSLRFEINSTEVYAFTPKGEVISLPQGSTPVDFAYAIHTEVGNRTIGARVNNRLVPLESELSNGDVVEIFTSKAENAGPSRDWLAFVASPRARNKIRHHFTRERREESIENGKEALARQMRKAGLPMQRLLTLEHLTAVAGFFKLPDVSSLYAAVGEDTVGAQAVVNRLISVEGGEDAAADETSEDRVVTGRRSRHARQRAATSGIRVVGADRPVGQAGQVLHAGPRRPDPGLRHPRRPGSRCTARTASTPPSLRAEPERLIEVEWAPTAKSSFLVAIQVEALDRNRLLSDITRMPVRPARQHPVRGPEHHEGPDLQGEVHLRDRRPDPPRPRPRAPSARSPPSSTSTASTSRPRARRSLSHRRGGPRPDARREVGSRTSRPRTPASHPLDEGASRSLPSGVRSGGPTWGWRAGADGTSSPSSRRPPCGPAPATRW